MKGLDPTPTTRSSQRVDSDLGGDPKTRRSQDVSLVLDWRPSSRVFPSLSVSRRPGLCRTFWLLHKWCHLVSRSRRVLLLSFRGGASSLPLLRPPPAGS